MSLLPTQITDALAVLARGCTAANGYLSNVGANVAIGRLAGAAVEAPICFVIPARQQPSTDLAFGAACVVREYELKAFADLQDHPTLDEHALMDQIIWDVRRVVEAEGTDLRDLATRVTWLSDTPGYHEQGGSLVGATITYEIEYRLDPDNPDQPA